MRIVISSGHGKYVRGASGYIDEVDEARRVVDEVARTLDTMGVSATVFHDDVSHTQDENIHRIVNFHNGQTRDLDVSVHFNANKTTNNPVGTECWYQTQQDLSAQVATAIADAGHLIDRGPKHTTSLYFLNHTEMPAILIEVCFVDSKADSNLYRDYFEAICGAIAGALAGETVPGRPERPPVEPPPTQPPFSHPTIAKGDNGPAVVELQQKLGVLDPDGDFGGITDTWVRAFQASCGLGVDGVVGNKTWAQVDDLNMRVAVGTKPLPADLASRIYTMAQESEIADYSWPDRGIPPPGYIAGMALAYAYCERQSFVGDNAVEVMGQVLGSSDTDALTWYRQELSALGGGDTSETRLRHLFVLMIGLGPRESSGRYCEGRDMAASNVESDTCEAGLFQTSWNIRGANGSIPPLLGEFWDNPNGFLTEFKEGVSPTANNLNSYGSGDGIKYQFLSRFCPLFHTMVTGVGLRTRRSHWGPINNKAVTIKREADDLLKDVQDLVSAYS